jgi:hypothetical protein
LPASGSLCQYASGGLGSPILAPATQVTDPSGRVIFVPGLNGAGAPYDAFSFVANDGQYDSPAAQITVNIITPPIVSPGGLSLSPAGAFNLSFPGFSNAAYTVWASTNLSNWVLLGSALQPTPGQFQFTDTGASNWPARYYRVRSP